MCDEMLTTFTFTGKMDKKVFAKSEVYLATKEALKTQGTEREIELSIQAVLKHAKDRRRSHKKRN